MAMYAPEGDSDSSDVEVNTQPEGDPRPYGFAVFVKCLVITSLTTYPFIGAVRKVSNLGSRSLQPCSGHGCTFVKIVPDDGLPSTVHMWANPFSMVRNGVINETSIPATYSPPMCPNMTANDMCLMCAKVNLEEPGAPVVLNTLADALSKTVYLWCIGGWFLFKVLHDWMLLQGCDDRTTLHIGFWSIVFQRLAVAAVFLWSMGAAEIFRAPLSDNRCSCYYSLASLELFLCIATPAALYVAAIMKAQAFARSVLVGDYLYFMQYDIPLRVVQRSIRDPTGSFLVLSTHGRHQCDDTHRELTTKELIDMDRLCSVISFLETFVERPCVGIALGPIMRIVMATVVYKIKNGSFLQRQVIALCSMCLLLGLLFVVVKSNLSWFLNLHTCGWHDRVMQWDRRHFWGTLFVSCMLVSCTTVGTAWILNSLMLAYFGFEVHQDPEIALRWAAGFVALYIGICRPAIGDAYYTIRCAIAAKARLSSWTQADYMLAAETLELEMDDERKLAEAFLQSQGSPRTAAERDDWQSRWKRDLSLSLCELRSESESDLSESEPRADSDMFFA